MVDGLAFGWVCILVEDVEFFVEMKNLIRREEGGQNERMFNYFVHCKKSKVLNTLLISVKSLN